MHQQSGWTATPSRLIYAPTSIIPTIFTPDAFLTQPSQFILAWEKHQICWLAYLVAWFYNKSTKNKLMEIDSWGVFVTKPTEVITLFVVLVGQFCGAVLSFVVEHWFIEVGLCHSTVIYYMVAWHHIRTSDPTQHLIIKSRFRWIQNNLPFIVDSCIGL